MKILILVFLSLLSIQAVADQGFYVGGGGGLVRFDDEVATGASLKNVELGAAELLGGYKYNNALGIEVRAGSNLKKRTIATGGVEREIAIDHYESIYYRPELTNPEAKLYALIGYSQVEQSSSTGTDEVSDSLSGLSYGIGIGFTMNPDFNFNIEYRRLLDESDFEINIAGINIDYRF